MTRMVFRRRSLFAALLPVVLVLLGGCGDGPEHDAEAMDIEIGDQVTLADGTDMRVSSRNGQEIWVQFRADGDGWTEPEKVHEETDRWTHEVELEQAGDSVGINPSYWKEEVLNDDYAPELTLQIICHDGSCTDAVASTRVVSTHFSEDGTAAWFFLDGATLAFWSVEGGQQPVTLEGVAPDFRYDVQDDGSLVALTGRRVGDNCQLALLTVAPGEATTEDAAATAEYPGSAECPLGPVEFEDGEVITTTFDGVDTLADLDPAYLVRFIRDDGWTVDQARNPVEVVPDTQGESTLGSVLLQLADGSAVAIGSVDRVRITAQVLPPDSEEDWSAPIEVATAPTGTVCRTLLQPDGLDYQPGVTPSAFLVVGCGVDDGGPLGAWRPAQGLVLASTDGYEWIVQPLKHPDTLPFTFGERVVAFGSNGAAFTWQPGEERLTRLRLGADGRTDRIGTTADGTQLVRVRGNADPDAPCRPTWSIADPDANARSWPAEQPLPKTAAAFPKQGTCHVEKIFTDGDLVRIVVADTERPWKDWTGALVRTGRGWQAYESDDLPE